MSTITKQAVHAVADLKAGYTLGHADVAMLNELARIALASLEAEPVGYFGRFDADDEDLIDQCSHNIRGAFPLYTAPPAPVSVPEWTNEQCLEFLSIAFRHAEIKGDLELDDIRLGVKMVNGSRAAMLQGAEQTNYRAIVERIAEIIHGKVTDIDLLTVTVKSMKDKLQK